MVSHDIQDIENRTHLFSSINCEEYVIYNRVACILAESPVPQIKKAASSSTSILSFYPNKNYEYLQKNAIFPKMVHILNLILSLLLFPKTSKH